MAGAFFAQLQKNRMKQTNGQNFCSTRRQILRIFLGLVVVWRCLFLSTNEPKGVICKKIFAALRLLWQPLLL